MRHVMVPFAVGVESIGKTKTLIATYINEIRKKEPGTVFYKSFQQEADPNRFVHVMAFKNVLAEKFHKTTDHNKTFIEALYPLCTEMPEAIVYNEIE